MRDAGSVGGFVGGGEGEVRSEVGAAGDGRAGSGGREVGVGGNARGEQGVWRVALWGFVFDSCRGGRE